MNDFRPCLCIIFNHPYPENIPILDRIYQTRFPIIRYLMPFTQLPERDDVITVYRGSYHHHGYVTDAASQLNQIDCSHYIFMQDDVFLNPTLNANNIHAVLQIERDDGFVSLLQNIVLDIGDWPWILGFIWMLFHPFNAIAGSGVSFKTLLEHLPPLEEAKIRAANHNMRFPVVSRSTRSFEEDSALSKMQYFGQTDPQLNRDLNRALVDGLFFNTKDKNTINIPYPFVRAGWAADLYVIPKTSLLSFARYCGVLAAAGIFSEISVGTAMLASVNRIKRSSDNGSSFDWRWGTTRNNVDFDDLLKRFTDQKFVAVHPIKLSLIRQNEPIMNQLFRVIEHFSVGKYEV